jgi:hypothetical protein
LPGGACGYSIKIFIFESAIAKDLLMPFLPAGRKKAWQLCFARKFQCRIKKTGLGFYDA